MTLHEALRQHPSSAELHVHLGLMLCREGRMDKAAKSFQWATECDCSRADAYYYRGLCEAALGHCAAAVRDLERALSLQPDNVLMAYQLAAVARAAAEQGSPVQIRLPEPSRAPATSHLRYLAEFVCKEPDFISAFLALPDSPADEELFGLLSAILETALEMHPGYADLHFRQALVLQRVGNAVAAREHAQRAVEINPNYVQGQILYGRLLAEHEPPEAALHLQMAVECGGDYADVHTLLAQLYHRMGRLDEARTELHSALRVNGDYAPARQALASLAA